MDGINGNSIEQLSFAPLYLHLFNREIYRSVINDRIDSANLNQCDILKTIMIAGLNNLYCSYSAFWETYHMLNIDGVMYRKLYEAGIITVVDETLSQNTFISTKQTIYKFDRERYPAYFLEDKALLNIKPAIPKIVSATDIIDDIFSNQSNDQLLNFALRRNDRQAVQKNRKAINSIVKKRGEKAITASLFRDASIDSFAKSSITRVISGVYLDHYREFLEGDIITGIPELLEYDYLSKNFPYFDYQIIKELLLIVGLKRLYENNISIIEISSKYHETHEHKKFSIKLRELIQDMLNYLNQNTLSNFLTASLRVKIISSLKSSTWDFKVKEIDINHKSNFYDEALANLDMLSKHIESKINKNGGYRKMENSSNDVFVVIGRNSKLRLSFFNYLRSLGLNPLEWTEVLARTEEATPYVGDAIEKSITEAGAVVVLLSPDEDATLREEFRENPSEGLSQPQPRPNVLFEAGMAYGINKRKVVIVQFGEIRTISDIFGRHILRYQNTPTKKAELANRLRTAGCKTRENGTDYLTIDIEF